MPPVVDIGAKRLIGLAPDAWARWVMKRQDVVAGEVVTGEFQWVSRQTDALLRVDIAETGPFLLLKAFGTLARYPNASDFEPLLTHVARLVLGSEVATRVARLDMAQIEQSDYYQEIVERGRVEALQGLVLRVLRHRFGEIPQDITERLQVLSSERLSLLAEAVSTDGSLDRFHERLATP